MNTLFVFLVRRDQVPQLVVYLLLGLVVLALEFGTPGPERDSEPAASLASAGPETTVAPLLR